MWVRLLHGSRGGSVLGIRVGGPRLLSQHLTTASVLVVVALSWIALEQNVSRPRVVLSTDLDICRGAILSMWSARSELRIALISAGVVFAWQSWW